MSSGYSETPLFKKLGIQEGQVIGLLNVPVYYHAILPVLPADVTISTDDAEKKDLIHFFVTDAEACHRQLPALREQIKQHGCIWVSWPKKASKYPTDLTEDLVRSIAIHTGLVDTKVCSVNETWSALKFVIPLQQRV
jgi:hypothetical protein